MDIGTITDDQTEKLIVFVRELAAFKLYGAETDEDGDDAMSALNAKVEEARALIGRDARTRVYNGEDAVAPTFRAGDRFLFVYPEEYETGEDYRAHSGQVVTIIRPMTYPEEYENMGDPMYKCRAADGWEGDIWESELEAHNG